MTDRNELERLAVRQRNCRANLKRRLKDGAPAKTFAYYYKAVHIAECEYSDYREIYLAERKKR